MALMQRKKERQVCRDMYAKGNISLIKQICDIFFVSGRKEDIVLLSGKRVGRSNKKHRTQRSNNQVYRVRIAIMYLCEEYSYERSQITDLSTLDSHVTIAIHIKHVRYTISQSLISGW